MSMPIFISVSISDFPSLNHFCLPANHTSWLTLKLIKHKKCQCQMEINLNY